MRTSAEGARILVANDQTLRDSYWYDLRARHPAAAALKRTLDVVLVLVALALLWPVMLAGIVSLGIERQRRVGFRAQQFDLYRFAGASGWLAMLPALANVLEGTMSLVGPEAVTPAEFNEAGLSSAMRRFATTPGLIGPRASSRAERLRLERDYLNEWSLARDLRLLARALSRRR